MKPNHGMQHMSKRKRQPSFTQEPLWMQRLDKLMIFIAVLSPVMTLPQIWKIFAYQNAAGVSAFSWGAYVVLNVPWLIYGVAHKEKIIIINSALWLVINTLVTIGALMY
jgi:uncharacterized protein with PQ loop repeat